MKSITKTVAKKVAKEAKSSVKITINLLGDDVQIDVYPIITMRKYIELVERVVDGVLSEEDNDYGYSYMPYLKNYVFETAFVESFCDISLPDRHEDTWNFLAVSRIFDAVCNAVSKNNPGIIEKIKKAIDETIEQRIMLFSRDRRVSRLALSAKHFVDELTKKIGDAKDMDDISKLFKDLIAETKTNAGEHLNE